MTINLASKYSDNKKRDRSKKSVSNVLHKWTQSQKASNFRSFSARNESKQ